MHFGKIDAKNNFENSVDSNYYSKFVLPDQIQNFLPKHWKFFDLV